MKFLTVTMMLVVVLGLAGGLQAVMALDQDFEGFTLGSLGTAGQGSTADAGGKWFATNAAADPSIVQDPDDPNNNQCVRITGGQAMLAGYSLAAPIAEGTPFILAFSVYAAIWDAENVGSFYLYSDNIASLDPDDSRGVAMHTYTEGTLAVYDGKAELFRSISGGQENLNNLRETWVDFKIHVKTWDAYDGYGRWDLWYNANQGNGWVQMDRDNPFESAKLRDGVNSLLFRPRTPNFGILAYFDNIYMTTEPLDCQEALMFAGGPQPADYDADCVVDYPDLGAWAPAWLEQLANDPVDWDYKWDCDELPADSSLWEIVQWGTPLGTQSVSAGIYTVSTVDTDAGGLIHWTVEGVYDASYPLMVELRSRMQLRTASYTAYLVVYDQLYASAGIIFNPGQYYEDAEGWSTTRMVTFLDAEDRLEEMRLYAQRADGTWWFANVSAGLNLTGTDAPRDLIYFGDPGSAWEGTWQEDYFYWTQNQPAIESFLADVALQPYDLTADGLINLEDFALLASDWLIDITP